MSKGLLDQFKRIRQELAGNERTMVVPELLDGDGNPLVVHVLPATLGQLEKIQSESTPIGVMVQTIIQRALGPNRAPLFAPAEYDRIKREMTPALLYKIANFLSADAIQMLTGEGWDELMGKAQSSRRNTGSAKSSVKRSRK